MHACQARIISGCHWYESESNAAEHSLSRSLSFSLPFCHLCAHLSPPPRPLLFFSLRFFSSLRSDSYFDYIMLALFSLRFSVCKHHNASLSHRAVRAVYACVQWYLLTYTSILWKLSKCHRRLWQESKSECIIVETVKSLTGRDTIYIYGFLFCYATAWLWYKHTLTNICTPSLSPLLTFCSSVIKCGSLAHANTLEQIRT